VLPKWVYPLLVIFVVFFILSNPENAGAQAQSFFRWVGEQASAFATFLDGLFGNDPVDGGGGDGFSTMRPTELLQSVRH